MMTAVRNGIEIDGFIREAVDMSRAALGVNHDRTPRVRVPLSDGCVPDKVIGKVELFYFTRGGWIPKAVPLKGISDGKDAHDGFLHWVGFRTYQLVGGIFRFLIWQSIQQFSQAASEVKVAIQRKREWVNPLMIQNPGDARFTTINKIFLNRRDLFLAMKREAILKCAMGVAIVASVVLLAAGVLTYQPALLYASAVCATVPLGGVGYFSLRREDSFSEQARDILDTEAPQVAGSPMSRSPSVSGDEEPPPPFTATPVQKTEKFYTVFGNVPTVSSDASSFEQV